MLNFKCLSDQVFMLGERSRDDNLRIAQEKTTIHRGKKGGAKDKERAGQEEGVCSGRGNTVSIKPC